MAMSPSRRWYHTVTKVSEDIKKNVQEKMDAAKAARTGTDASAIKSASDALSTEMSKIGQAMNQQQTPPTDQKPPENPGGEQAK